MDNFCGVLSKRDEPSSSKAKWVNPTITLSNFLNTFNDLEKITKILSHALEDSFQNFVFLSQRIFQNNLQALSSQEVLRTIREGLKLIKIRQEQVDDLLMSLDMSIKMLEKYVGEVEGKILPNGEITNEEDPRAKMYKILTNISMRFESNKEFLGDFHREVHELNSSNNSNNFPPDLTLCLDRHVQILEKIKTNLDEMTRIGEENHIKLTNIESQMKQ
ncbi:uncharacterized protein LOC129793904 [Lutzomyia longipalpis]|uniref:uncharacterized protein LOC129793904 n=1 Tax=Lutzomyia longipalpis TaxID=7200 RepID=UPI0024841B03|nr:uncharacterized protein LOC129793904 [Lutzomyia longipalpis]